MERKSQLHFDPSPFSENFKKEMNSLIINEATGFIKDNRGYIAGAGAIGLTTIIDNTVFAATGTKSEIPLDKLHMYIKLGATGLGVLTGVTKELLDKEKDQEQATKQLVGNAVIGGFVGYSAADLGLLYYTSLFEGKQFSIPSSDEIHSIMRTFELPILYFGLKYIKETTGSFVRDVSGKVSETMKHSIEEIKARHNETNEQLLKERLVRRSYSPNMREANEARKKLNEIGVSEEERRKMHGEERRY